MAFDQTTVHPTTPLHGLSLDFVGHNNLSSNSIIDLDQYYPVFHDHHTARYTSSLRGFLQIMCHWVVQLAADERCLDESVEQELYY